MAKKKFLKIPKRIDIKCPNCDYIMRLEVREDNLINSVECKNCKNIIKTPVTQCCIICAFSDKKCPPNLKIEAKAKGLVLI